MGYPVTGMVRALLSLAVAFVIGGSANGARAVPGGLCRTACIRKLIRTRLPFGRSRAGYTRSSPRQPFASWETAHPESHSSAEAPRVPAGVMLSRTPHTCGHAKGTLDAFMTAAKPALEGPAVVPPTFALGRAPAVVEKMHGRVVGPQYGPPGVCRHHAPRSRSGVRCHSAGVDPVSRVVHVLDRSPVDASVDRSRRVM